MSLVSCIYLNNNAIFYHLHSKKKKPYTLKEMMQINKIIVHVILRLCKNRLILLKGLLLCVSATGVFKFGEPLKIYSYVIKSLRQQSFTLHIVRFTLAYQSSCFER
jgi:hypothetical protein